MARRFGDENWGERVKRASGGELRGLVRSIAAIAGPLYGTRNTFAKLYEFEDVPTAQIWRERAWLLVVAADYNPADFGLTDVDAPAMLRLDQAGFEQGLRMSL